MRRIRTHIIAFSPHRALNSDASNSCREVIQFLTERGTDVTAQRDYATAPVSAAQNGYIEVVKVLLDNGADVDATCAGWTALMVAAEKGHRELIKILLGRGTTINASCDRLALSRPCDTGHLGDVKALPNKEAHINPRCNTSNSGETVLKRAAKKGQVDTLHRGIEASIGHFEGGRL